MISSTPPPTLPSVWRTLFRERHASSVCIYESTGGVEIIHPVPLWLIQYARVKRVCSFVPELVNPVTSSLFFALFVAPPSKAGNAVPVPEIRGRHREDLRGAHRFPNRREGVAVDGNPEGGLRPLLRGPSAKDGSFSGETSGRWGATSRNEFSFPLGVSSKYPNQFFFLCGTIVTSRTADGIGIAPDVVSVAATGQRGLGNQFRLRIWRGYGYGGRRRCGGCSLG